MAAKGLMIKHVHYHLIAVSVSTVLSLVVLPAMAQKPPVYKGGVNMNQELLKPKPGPGLNRNVLPPNGDTFGNDGPPDVELQQNVETMPVQRPRPQAQPQLPQRNFGGQIEDLDDVLDGLIPQSAPMHGNVQQQQQIPSNMQDGPDMVVAWDMWHRRVAEEVYIRFKNLATTAFPDSEPLGCSITYSVTRDGQITNIKIVSKSTSDLFDKMVFQVVKSMNGNPCLQFPAGSRRQLVDKGGNFEHNFGPGRGFKYLTDDKEKITGPPQIQRTRPPGK